MPIIESAKKRARQNIKERQINTARKSAIKTAIKKVLTALASNDVAQAQALLKDVQVKLARAKSKRVMHANTASRKLGRLAKRVSSAQRSASTSR